MGVVAGYGAPEGGSGISLFDPNPPVRGVNLFVGANRVGAEQARDDYFAANPDDLARYDRNASLWIVLEFRGNIRHDSRIDGTWYDAIGTIDGLGDLTSHSVTELRDVTSAGAGLIPAVADNATVSSIQAIASDRVVVISPAGSPAGVERISLFNPAAFTGASMTSGNLTLTSQAGNQTTVTVFNPDSVVQVQQVDGDVVFTRSSGDTTRVDVYNPDAITSGTISQGNLLLRSHSGRTTTLALNQGPVSGSSTRRLVEITNTIFRFESDAELSGINNSILQTRATNRLILGLPPQNIQFAIRHLGSADSGNLTVSATGGRNQNPQGAFTNPTSFILAGRSTTTFVLRPGDYYEVDYSTSDVFYRLSPQLSLLSRDISLMVRYDSLAEGKTGAPGSATNEVFSFFANWTGAKTLIMNIGGIGITSFDSQGMNLQGNRVHVLRYSIPAITWSEIYLSAPTVFEYRITNTTDNFPIYVNSARA